MITTYHRPKTLDEALALLTQENRIPLGGGTLLSKPTSDSVEVVDLQAIGLNTVKRQGNTLELGATVTLQQLFESEFCPPALTSALRLEAPLNVRNTATVAGTLVAGDGRSTFATALLALDARLEIKSTDRLQLAEMETESGPPQTAVETLSIGEFLPLRADRIKHKLITAVIVPTNVKLTFEYVSRTPADKPIVCAAVARWNSGRTRLALGGYGKVRCWPWMGPKPRDWTPPHATPITRPTMNGRPPNTEWTSPPRWQNGVCRRDTPAGVPHFD